MLYFTKMEGLGNDYIYFDGIHQNIPTDKEFITRISNYHTGIGSDGMIVILKSQEYDFRMRMFNKDGSESEMCGNGIRCFAKYVYDHQLSDKTDLEIETLAGVRKVSLNIKNEEVVSVRVDMGSPCLNVSDIPCIFDKHQMINESIQIDNETYHLTSLSMGNPHTVMFVNNFDFDLKALGQKIENSRFFPNHVNIEFIKVINRNKIKMRVWERGSGETKACGTGACAAMYASYINGLCEEKIQVELSGGILDIEFKDGKIFMSGEVKTTFEGVIDEQAYCV